MPIEKMVQLTIAINQRIEQLEKDRKRLFESIGELIIKNKNAYDDLPSILITSIEDSKQVIHDIDLEIATLDWVLEQIRGEHK